MTSHQKAGPGLRHDSQARTAAETGVRVSFGHTVEREMVHRTAVAEVFVTDMHALGGDRYLAGAQLPLRHSYFSDHRLDPPLFDPLLMLEASRQAAVYGTHRFLGVSAKTSFLVNTLSIRLNGLGGLHVGNQPAELHISTEYPSVKTRDSRVRSVDVKQWLAIGGKSVGEVAMTVSALTPREHLALRFMQRGGTPPTTDTGAPAWGSAVPPESVGRKISDNVVLAAPIREKGTVAATVAPNVKNRSLFDHSYDHIPGMVLMECARQMALFAVDDGSGEVARHIAVAGCSALFQRFAELDAPVRAVALEPLPGIPGVPITVPVRFEQEEAVVAETEVILAAAPERSAP